jgi:predicted amidohydrolase YtcJ
LPAPNPEVIVMSQRLDPAALDRRRLLLGAAGGAALGLLPWERVLADHPDAAPDLILHGGRIHRMDRRRRRVEALAIRGGRIVASGDDRRILGLRGPATRVVDLSGRTVIPGLNDSHTHLIRGGLHYNLELRWDGVPSLAIAMRMLREQAARTPAPQWIQIVGGFSIHQFAEKRLPTLAELNAAAPDTPVYLLNVYDRALLNRAALRAIGWTRDTPDPPAGGVIERDRRGNPTGVVIARPGPRILLQTLALAPRLGFDDELNSTRQFMREYNRLGVTSVADAGGGFQRFPEDYRVIEALHRRGELTLRIAYNLFTQTPGRELDDLAAWGAMRRQWEGDSYYRMNGAGENLVVAAADFENFVEPRPELGVGMEEALEAAVRRVFDNGWGFRLHATYGESIKRFLDVFERIDRDIPFAGKHWILDHAETISRPDIDRVAGLGGIVAVQHRMAFVGEEFVARYGAEAAESAPPLRDLLEAGVAVVAGSDGTRASGYNPWTTLYWLTTGRTLGGLRMASARNLLDRTEALALSTSEAARVSREDDDKGSLEDGKLADIAVLSDDYFSVEDEAIKGLSSVLTVLGGRVVHADGPFRELAPPPLKVSPDWSPVAFYGGYWRGSGDGGIEVDPRAGESRTRKVDPDHVAELRRRVFSGCRAHGDGADPLACICGDA